MGNNRKKWIWLAGFDCPNCGDELEVFTDASQHTENGSTGTFIYDGDDVRCVGDCGFKSCAVVYDVDSIGIDEGNIEELEPI